MGRYNFWQRNAQKARDSKNQQNVDVQQKASHASKENSQPFPKIKSNQLFGSSILTNGTYMSDSNKLDLLGIDHESESSYYRDQQKYSQPIINAANNSCNEILNRKKGPLNVSSDASYDHRRNGSWCFSYIMEGNECVGFNTIGKTGGKRTLGTFTGTSNMMESTAFRGDLNKMIDNLDDINRLKTINHDDNNLSGNVIHEHKNVVQLHDVGHFKKNLSKKFDDFKKQTQQELHRKSLFRGIKKHLLAWFMFIVHYISDKAERGKQWLNATNHWIGKHYDCYHNEKNKKVGRPKKDEKNHYFFWNEGEKNPILKKN